MLHATLFASALVLQPQAVLRSSVGRAVTVRSPFLSIVENPKTVASVKKLAEPGVIADAKQGTPITEAEVLAAQDLWASSVKSISRIYLDGDDYVAAAADAASKLYGYGHGDVLFKPTRCAEYQFRPTGEEAMSYFVGCDAVKGGYTEDTGFAINGGKGWSDVVFFNHKVELRGETAIAMGNYYFTDASNGKSVKVEYTFGYKRCADGKLRIFLHHSSVPFGAGLPPAVTKEEILEVQDKWAAAIAEISKLYMEGGDFMGAAGAAAGELYGYGHGEVLFKPTRCAEVQFRPTAAEAMSYFVGKSNVDQGYDEDAGFAINGGKGWASVKYMNHQVEIVNGVGIAMGNYDFTCATTGAVSRVEYTFNYKKCADGKVRPLPPSSHHPPCPRPATARVGGQGVRREDSRTPAMPTRILPPSLFPPLLTMLPRPARLCRFASSRTTRLCPSSRPRLRRPPSRPRPSARPSASTR
jgi:hypothetical protein